MNRKNIRRRYKIRKTFRLEHKGVKCKYCNHINRVEGDVLECPDCGEVEMVEWVRLKKDFISGRGIVFFINFLAFLVSFICTFIFYFIRYHPAIGIIFILGMPLFLLTSIKTYLDLGDRVAEVTE